MEIDVDAWRENFVEKYMQLEGASELPRLTKDNVEFLQMYTLILFVMADSFDDICKSIEKLKKKTYDCLVKKSLEEISRMKIEKDMNEILKIYLRDEKELEMEKVSYENYKKKLKRHIYLIPYIAEKILAQQHENESSEKKAERERMESNLKKQAEIIKLAQIDVNEIFSEDAENVSKISGGAIAGFVFGTALTDFGVTGLTFPGVSAAAVSLLPFLTGPIFIGIALGLIVVGVESLVYGVVKSVMQFKKGSSLQDKTPKFQIVTNQPTNQPTNQFSITFNSRFTEFPINESSAEKSRS